MRLEKDYEREEMLTSIKECGVMDPIKVKGGSLNFTGNRRIKYSNELGLKTTRAEIWEDISDSEAVLMGFVENINRKDFTLFLHPAVLKTRQSRGGTAFSEEGYWLTGKLENPG